MVPLNDAYSSGWSSVGTASRLVPAAVGAPFGTAQLLRTPSRSSRRSQCTRSPVLPRGVWCSWTTNVSSFPAGRVLPAAGTGSAVFRGSRLARYSASGSSRPPRGRAGTSGAAAGALGRSLLRRRALRAGRRRVRGRLARGGLLRRRLLRGGLLGRRLLRRGLLRGRLLGRRRCLRCVVRGGAGHVARGPAAGALDAAPQRAHEVDHGGAGVGDL